MKVRYQVNARTTYLCMGSHYKPHTSKVLITRFWWLAKLACLWSPSAPVFTGLTVTQYVIRVVELP